MQADTPPPRPPIRKRRPAPTRTNTLLIVLPPLLLTEPSSSQLLPLFQAHFASYGNLLSWTPLLKLGRVVAVYEDDDGAGEAKGEMDGFVWEEDDERGDEPPHPLRVFYGPRFTISHITRLPGHTSHSAHTPGAQGGGIPESVLLTVPSSGKNFLISPPGSPPVGWEQTEEEEPNREVFHPEDGIQPVEVDVKSGTFSEGWADELTRALRFLSVDAGGDEDEGDDAAAPSPPPEDGDEERQTTQLVLPPHPPLSSTSLLARPAVTVSSPPPSHSSTPPPPQSRGRDITQVKATLESMLGRKRSMSDLRRQASSSGSGGHSRSGSAASLGEDLAVAATPSLGLGAGLGAGGGARITPTARPPLA